MEKKLDPLASGVAEKRIACPDCNGWGVNISISDGVQYPQAKPMTDRERAAYFAKQCKNCGGAGSLIELKATITQTISQEEYFRRIKEPLNG